MPALSSQLRRLVERKIVEARRAAESAARTALTVLAVEQPQPHPTLSSAQRQRRNPLRARARQLGEGRLEAGVQPLIEEIAYEQWHRMLFARFLAENDLLYHPEHNVPVTLEECAGLADEQGEGDRWSVAAEFASAMLPGIFRTGDPSAQVRFAPEGHLALERILDELPPALFTADDGLGWTYQFWQKERKQAVDEDVKRSGRKVGGADLAPVTQLFTEDYMVRFLLQNSLGAWWAARHPESPLVKAFEYLRFKDDGTPAAGTFDGWPATAAEVTVMDPCCGSGHFLVAAFEMLWRMRMEEEGLSEAEAADAVLRDNIFGLELDPRCLQIGAFALALAAWKAGGYRPLPLPNLACSGIPVSGQLEEWTKLAGDDVDLRHSLERVYHLFRKAPDLGSLISPADVPLRDRMFAPDYSKVGPLLERALLNGMVSDDPVAAVFGDTASRTALAAGLLSRHYVLLATNVPYLGRRDQGPTLREFSLATYPEAEANLATVFVMRCIQLARSGGSLALVTPQLWFSQVSYTTLRKRYLREQTIHQIARLGSRAFQTITGEVVNVALMISTHQIPSINHLLSGIDVSLRTSPREKAGALGTESIKLVSQNSLLGATDLRITLQADRDVKLLSDYTWSLQGTTSGDNPRYVCYFWEVPLPAYDWEPFQSTVSTTRCYGGREFIIRWQKGRGPLASSPQARIQGQAAFGNHGVSVKQMGAFPCSLYTGDMFDMNCATIIPKNVTHLPAIWAFCSSPEFNAAVRQIDTALKVTNATLVKVPFDLAPWQKVADEQYPNGLPEPYSNDPTQWFFRGDPADSTEPLQVTVARLLGYRWPQQESDRLSGLAVLDGIVPLVPVAGVEPADERLRALLAAAFGDGWTAARQQQLLDQVGYGDKGLDPWLRDGFFEQHCKLFHQRPFIWQIWDGRRDGFSALVNYHRLDAALLEKLTYTYLGDWIRTQRSARDAGTAGADARLVAALELQRKLEAIREGEPPYDIYVRWKPLHQQPIGWEPDLNDGVRLNIRPFVEAGVLRGRVNVKWGKDRGANPDGSARLNDIHLTRAEKQRAREAQSAALAAALAAGGASV